MNKKNPKEQSAYNNKFDGLMNAAPYKRYKSFAVTVADWESVWLDCDPNQPLPDEGVISVWPEECSPPSARISRSSRWTCMTSATCWERTRMPRFASSRTEKLDGHGGGRFAGGRARRTRPGGVRA